MRNQEQINYLTFKQAQNLVDRISDRTSDFGYDMTDNEREAMAQLLSSDIGVTTSDLIDVRYLADNYAVNAEIVTPQDLENYDYGNLEDALFSWEEEDGTYYCMRW